MADKKENGDRTEVPATGSERTLEFSLSEKEKKAVIDCIEKRGKLSVVLTELGQVDLGGGGLEGAYDGPGKLKD